MDSSIPKPVDFRKRSAQLFDDQSIFLEINRLVEEITSLYPSEINVESVFPLNQTRALCADSPDMSGASLEDRIEQSVQLTSQVNQLLLQAVDLLTRKSQ